MATGPQQPAPEATSERALLNPAGHSNDSAIAKNNLLDWPVLKAQESVLEPSPNIVPIPSASIRPGTSAKSSGNDETPLLRFSVDPSAEHALIHTGNRSHAVASQIAESVTEIPTNISSSNEDESKPHSGNAESTVHTSDDGPIQVVPRKSRTIDSLRDFLLIFRYSNRSLDGSYVTSLGERLKHGFRRSRSWLDPRPLIFNRLEDQLKAAMEPSYLEHRNFLPRGQLYQLFTQRSVNKELARRKCRPRKGSQTQRGPISIPIEEHKPQRKLTHGRPKSDSELFQKHTGGTYRKIFAILVFIRRPDEIWSFVEEGVCDADLPLEEMQVDEKRGGHLDLRCKRGLHAPLRCFKDWEEGAIKDFAEHQWIVLAPVFERSKEGDVPHLELHPKNILPFTWKPLERGGFGQVYEAKIHPDHHNFDRALVRDLPRRTVQEVLMKLVKPHVLHNVVAVKQLLPREGGVLKTKEAFEIESRVLRNLSREGHTHQHLISLLATYEQGGNYFLIFPWADADLERFWEEIKPEPGMATWLIDQCQGLAGGLCQVHHYLTMSSTTMFYETSLSQENLNTTQTPSGSLKLFGRHGDIKPKNILWFRDRSLNDGYGTLRITDFGIAQFTTDNTEWARRRGIVPNSPTYRSPECDISDGQIGPQCDIWALGCVYLVFTTWFFGGWGYVKEFASKRMASDRFWHHKISSDTFFTIIEDESGTPRAKVKDSVVLMIEELRSRSASTDHFHTLLKHTRRHVDHPGK